MRNLENKVSRDADIVVAAMVSIVGSTLIFQGWRLDPLLLLCQALTTSVAFWYGVETFRLRSKEADMVRTVRASRIALCVGGEGGARGRPGAAAKGTGFEGVSAHGGRGGAWGRHLRGRGTQLNFGGGGRRRGAPPYVGLMDFGG